METKELKRYNQRKLIFTLKNKVEFIGEIHGYRSHPDNPDQVITLFVHADQAANKVTTIETETIKKIEIFN
jgi:hypothetical protein